MAFLTIIHLHRILPLPNFHHRVKLVISGVDSVHKTTDAIPEATF